MVPPDGATGRVRGFALDPLHSAVDLWPHTALGTTDDFALAPDAWGGAHDDRFRLRAEVETAGGWIPTRLIELRISDMTGFRGVLGECFGMPYVFGIAGVAEGDLSGVDTGWGSDCPNFLIHAWRRQGIPLSWGDPGAAARPAPRGGQGAAAGRWVSAGSYTSASPHGSVGTFDVTDTHRASGANDEGRATRAERPSPSDGRSPQLIRYLINALFNAARSEHAAPWISGETPRPSAALAALRFLLFQRPEQACGRGGGFARNRAA